MSERKRSSKRSQPRHKSSSAQVFKFIAIRQAEAEFGETAKSLLPDIWAGESLRDSTSKA